MGLDIVELIMRVEEEFSLEITDAEAELLTTPGALCDLITHKLGPAEEQTPSYCPTSRAFYAVRRELMQLGIPRQSITPGTSITALWPRSQRRRNWESLGNALNCELPALRRSPEWAFVALLPLGVFIVWLPNDPSAVVPVCAFYGLFWWLGFHATKPFASHAPDLLAGYSVADLARRISPRYCATDSKVAPVSWPRIRRIVADELNIPIERVTRNADFYRDLGLG
ncbi:acyl carrier protein [Abditibacteriota bacterium]|nr:acyl carrier protein [Abditibacteriota bacterium]